MVLSEESPVYGPFFGVMGAAAAIIFSGELSARKKKMEELCKFPLFEIHQSGFVNLPKSQLMTSFIYRSSPRSCLWNCQVWNGNCCDVCYEARIDHEEYNSRRHGWNHCDLWTCRRCSYRRCPRGARKIHTLQVSCIFLRIFTVPMRVMWPQKKNQWSQPITFSLACESCYTTTVSL